MQVHVIREENHGLIGIAATYRAAMYWLLSSGWVGRYSEIWIPDEDDCNGGRNMTLDELFGDNWEKQFIRFSYGALENMGFYIRKEDVIEEED